MSAGVDISALSTALKCLKKDELISIIVKKCIDFDGSNLSLSPANFEKLKTMISQHLCSCEEKSENLINSDVAVKENECLKREIFILKKSVTDLDYTIELQKNKILELSTKTFIFAFLVVAVAADKLQNNYLPPHSAKTAGGSGFLRAPGFSGSFGTKTFGSSSFGSGSAYTPSGHATSYAAPPSGPASSGHYGSQASSYSSGTPVAILRLNNENNGDGAYRFEYETENKITQQEQGHLENAGSDHESSVVHGSYSYQAPDGQTITVNYIADENGFRATGDHIPTPPPVPEAIRKSLEINAAASRTSSYSSSGSSSFGGSYQQGQGSSSHSGSYQSPQVNRQYLAPRTQSSGGYHY